jgi:hypothetical protein
MGAASQRLCGPVRRHVAALRLRRPGTRHPLGGVPPGSRRVARRQPSMLQHVLDDATPRRLLAGIPRKSWSGRRVQRLRLERARSAGSPELPGDALRQPWKSQPLTDSSVFGRWQRGGDTPMGQALHEEPHNQVHGRGMDRDRPCGRGSTRGRVGARRPAERGQPATCCPHSLGRDPGSADFRLHIPLAIQHGDPLTPDGSRRQLNRVNDWYWL